MNICQPFFLKPPQSCFDTSRNLFSMLSHIFVDWTLVRVQPRSNEISMTSQNKGESDLPQLYNILRVISGFLGHSWFCIIFPQYSIFKSFGYFIKYALSHSLPIPLRYILPTSCSLIPPQENYIKSSLLWPYTHWSMVKLPVAIPLKKLSSSSSPTRSH